MPSPPPGKLEQRAEISEQFRIGGPGLVRRIYPEFYSGKSPENGTHEGVSLASRLQDATQRERPPGGPSDGRPEGLPGSCCQSPPQHLKTRDGRQTPNRLPGAVKPEMGPRGALPEPSSSVHSGASFGFDTIATSIGTSSVPWTEPQHRQMLDQRPDEQYNCECGSGCACLGCRKSSSRHTPACQLAYQTLLDVNINCPIEGTC